MARNSLPEELKGEWIWSRRTLDALESYIFFRKEFTLSETPSAAELWLTARTFFHVFVNGRHLTFGPSACPTHDSYVVNLDVAFALETGTNSLAVLAHNTKVTRYAARRRPSGFWCQLNINGKPAVWSDTTWMLTEATCYAPDRPRRSTSGAFTEKVDLHAYPNGWQEREYNSIRWRHADYRVPVAEDATKLIPVELPELTSERREFSRIVLRGNCRQIHAITHVSFASLVDRRGPGVYGAEAHIHSPKAVEAEFELYGDNPYRFFVNGQLVKEQGVMPLPTGADLEVTRPACFRQSQMTDPPGEMNWHQGWNHLLLFQQTEHGCGGLTLIFPGRDPRDVRPLRNPGDEGSAGWALAGPLHVPLPNLIGSVSLQSCAKAPFIPVPGHPVDEGANLMGFGFEPTTGAMEVPEIIELRVGEYVVLDLGQSVLGVPEFVVVGEDEDAVDVVWGEHVVAGQLLPYHEGRNNVDSLLLGAKPCRWMGCMPRGFRYLMLIARRARTVVTFQDVGVVVRQYNLENQGSFECSDRVLNAVWTTGHRTLATTVQDTFMDSPSKENAQYIADAMIQSWAAYHVFGNYRLAAKSIEEFAKAQFETGEMPALCPSDIYLNMPDYVLLWPVWLHRHFLYTGDHHLLARLVPTLDSLFSYFAHVAVRDREILGDLDRRYGAYCFIDHGQIDRRGVVTGLNAIYRRALLSGAWLLDRVQNPRGAEILRRRAATVAREVRQLCWDPDRGLFADGWHDGGMSDFYSWQTNVLAIYGGIAPPEEYDAIFDKLFCGEPPYELIPAGDANNPFFKYFVLETAFALGRREWAIEYLRWYWGGMLARGAVTWWEMFNPDSKRDEVLGVSFCHGYGASPNAFLCTELAGIRPARPGFSQAFFHPLISVVKWVKAQIPTPYGRIVVEWRILDSGELEAVIDANYPLEVIPMLDSGISESAIIHVSDDVTILAAPTE